MWHLKLKIGQATVLLNGDVGRLGAIQFCYRQQKQKKIIIDIQILTTMSDYMVID